MSVYPVTTDTDTVLRLLRLLPPRERLRVVAQVLPELERDLLPTPSSSDFWQSDDVHTLAEHQGVQPIADFDALLGGWPEDEPVDDFIAAVYAWRQQNPAEVHASRPISVQDAWIAATALRHGCPLVTHNRDDFAKITGLTVISEA